MTAERVAPWVQLAGATLTTDLGTFPLTHFRGCITVVDPEETGLEDVNWWDRPRTMVRVFENRRNGGGKFHHIRFPDQDTARAFALCTDRVVGAANKTRASVECVECGEWSDVCFNSSTTESLWRRQVCFNCDFWLEKVRWATDPPAKYAGRIAVVGGRHWVVGSRATGDKSHMGCGGREVTVRWHDGRVTSTNNLWGQGTIPEHFRDRLPDTAVLEWEQ